MIRLTRLSFFLMVAFVCIGAIFIQPVFAQNPFTDPPPESPNDNLTTLTELRSVKDACAALGYNSGDAQKNCTQDLGWAASECTEETPQPQTPYGTVTDAQKDTYRNAHKQCVVDKASN